jgi:hypothetical protein
VPQPSPPRTIALPDRHLPSTFARVRGWLALPLASLLQIIELVGSATGHHHRRCLLVQQFRKMLKIKMLEKCYQHLAKMLDRKMLSKCWRINVVNTLKNVDRKMLYGKMLSIFEKC